MIFMIQILFKKGMSLRIKYEHYGVKDDDSQPSTLTSSMLRAIN